MCTEYKAFVRGRTPVPGPEAAGEVVEGSGRVSPGSRGLPCRLPAAASVALPVGEFIYCEQAPDFESIHGSREGTATMAQYLLKPDWAAVSCAVTCRSRRRRWLAARSGPVWSIRADGVGDQRPAFDQGWDRWAWAQSWNARFGSACDAYCDRRRRCARSIQGAHTRHFPAINAGHSRLRPGPPVPAP